MEFHCCHSIRGPLANWSKAEWKRNAKGWRKDGWPMTADQLKDFFMDQFSMGREVIPLGAPCEGFDYKTGCPGHEIKDDAEVTP